MFKYLFLTFISCLAISLYSGCTDSQWAEPFPDRLTITVLDSIGIETGDSCYVLGSIVDVEVSSSGSILLLDQSACCIREFSPEGTYLATLSRRGNGPGELLYPQEMALLPDGKIIVRDMLKRSLVILDRSEESVSELADWSYISPEAIVPADSRHFAACETEIEILNSQQFLLIQKPSLYSLTDTAQELVFHSDSVMMSVETVVSSPTGLLGGGYAIMATDGDGRLFYTRKSSTEYEIHCWDIEGNLLFYATLEIPTVAKTPQELLEETEYMKMQLASMGLNALPETSEPDPYHTLIVGMGVDKCGNLWIQRGTEEKPVFDIFNNDGEHIGSAEFPRCGRHWKFSISPNGSLVWNLDPVSGFQKVYMLELPEIN